MLLPLQTTPFIVSADNDAICLQLSIEVPVEAISYRFRVV